jgi:hypothetical protein
MLPHMSGSSREMFESSLVPSPDRCRVLPCKIRVKVERPQRSQGREVKGPGRLSRVDRLAAC